MSRGGTAFRAARRRKRFRYEESTNLRSPFQKVGCALYCRNLPESRNRRRNLRSNVDYPSVCSRPVTHRSPTSNPSLSEKT